MHAAALLIVLLAQTAPPASPSEKPAPSPGEGTAAATAREAPAAGECRLPVYFRSGEVRCSEKPASTAFGRFTWMEGGRWLTVRASAIDLERTLPIHEKAPRGGGFSVTGSQRTSVPFPAATASPPQTAPSRGLEVPTRTEWEGAPEADQTTAEEEPGLSPEDRSRLQEELRQARTELDVMIKQYRALALTGRAPSNTLSRAITQREQKIERIQEQLRR